MESEKQKTEPVPVPPPAAEPPVKETTSKKPRRRKGQTIETMRIKHGEITVDFK